MRERDRRLQAEIKRLQVETVRLERGWTTAAAEQRRSIAEAAAKEEEASQLRHRVLTDQVAELAVRKEQLSVDVLAAEKRMDQLVVDAVGNACRVLFTFACVAAEKSPLACVAANIIELTRILGFNHLSHIILECKREIGIYDAAITSFRLRVKDCVEETERMAAEERRLGDKRDADMRQRLSILKSQIANLKEEQSNQVADLEAEQDTELSRLDSKVSEKEKEIVVVVFKTSNLATDSKRIDKHIEA